MTHRTFDLDACRAMLAHLSPDLPRDEWAAVAMALKSEHGEAAFEVFDAWSKRGEKYQVAAARSTWRSVKAGGGVGIGTLVHLAKAAGWRPESVQTPAPPSPAESKAAAEVRRAAAEAERARQAQRQRECAMRAAELWAEAAEGLSAELASAAPYLVRKRLQGSHGARFAPGGVLRVPMRDAAGELWNVQDIGPDGAKLYAAGRGGRKAGLFHMIGEPDGAPVLLLAEGFATAASAHEATGRPAAVAFDAGNLAAVARDLRGLHPKARVAILADNDRDTERRTGRNPGREAADKAARAVRGVAVAPKASELPEGGSDWNDAAANVGRERVAALIEAAIAAALLARQAPAAGGGHACPLPSPENAPEGQDSRPAGAGRGGGGTPDEDATDFDPFALDDRGVWFQGFDMQGRPRPPLRVCGPLRVTARTRMRNGAGWGYLVEFTEPEGGGKEWVIGAAAMQGDGVRYREALADLGLDIEPGRGARERLAQYIQTRRPRAFARLVERAGWHGRAYVLPGRVFGDTEERLILAPEATNEHPFRQRGSLAKWRATIGHACEGNTRPAFAVSAAFAGPLLRLAGLQSGGFHFVGASSRGKSTSLHAAASVWGAPEGKRSWRSTDNAVEFLAQLHSDSLLILDELKQCDARIVGEAIYTLGNGTGRNRAAQRGGLRPTPAWSVLFLSSGEVTPEAHMATARMQPMEGQRVRMPSIPAEPEGCEGTAFETNHEHEGGAALSRFIEHSAALHYGHAGIAFLDHVAAEFEAVRGRLRDGLAAFRFAHVKESADGQIGRIADRFGLVATAGELATEWGITGWPQGWATQAAAACFLGMVKLRPGGWGSGEEAAMLRQVRTLIAEHREDWFPSWNRADEGDTHRPNAPRGVGWRKEITDAAADVTDMEFVCLPDPFRSMLCEGHDPERVAELLRRRGHLVSDNDGRLTRSMRLPGLGKKRCYVVRSSILDDQGEE